MLCPDAAPRKEIVCISTSVCVVRILYESEVHQSIAGRRQVMLYRVAADCVFDKVGSRLLDSLDGSHYSKRQ